MSIREQFEQFDRTNPSVYKTLVRLTFQAVDAGRSRLGIGMLWERLRWERFIQRDPEETYKLNNNYRALYARKLMDDYPEFDGLFETRRRRTA